VSVLIISSSKLIPEKTRIPADPAPMDLGRKKNDTRKAAGRRLFWYQNKIKGIVKNNQLTPFRGHR